MPSEPPRAPSASRSGPSELPEHVEGHVECVFARMLEIALRALIRGKHFLDGLREPVRVGRMLRQPRERLDVENESGRRAIAPQLSVALGGNRVVGGIDPRRC